MYIYIYIWECFEIQSLRGTSSFIKFSLWPKHTPKTSKPHNTYFKNIETARNLPQRATDLFSQDCRKTQLQHGLLAVM